MQQAYFYDLFLTALAAMTTISVVNADWPVPDNYTACKNFDVKFDRNVNPSEIAGTWYWVASTSSIQNSTFDATQARINKVYGCVKTNVGLRNNLSNVDTVMTMLQPVDVKKNTFNGWLHVLSVAHKRSRVFSATEDLQYNDTLYLTEGSPITHGHWIFRMRPDFVNNDVYPGDFYKLNCHEHDFLLWASCRGPSSYVDWGVWSRQNKLLSDTQKDMFRSLASLGGVTTAYGDYLYDIPVTQC